MRYDKIIVDILLLILMILQFSRGFFSPIFHEISGVGLIVLLLVHLILNRSYISTLTKGNYNRKRSIMLMINVLFFLSFTFSLIFGLVINHHILQVISIDIRFVYFHKIFSYSSILLLGLHLAVNTTNLLENIKKNIGACSFNILSVFVIFFGCYSILQLDFLGRLTGNIGFTMITTSVMVYC